MLSRIQGKCQKVAGWPGSPTASTWAAAGVRCVWQLRLEHVAEQVKQRGGSYGPVGAQPCARTQALGALATTAPWPATRSSRLGWLDWLEEGIDCGEEG